MRDFRDPDYTTTARDRAAFEQAHPGGNDRLLAEQAARAPVPLHDTEIRALDHYTGMAYQDINHALRSGDPALIARHAPEITNATSGLNKLPDYHGMVVRGLHFDNATDLREFLTRVRPGEIYEEPEFTSADKEFAHPGNVQLIIHSSHGKDISWLKDAHVGQKEVVYPQGSPFRVDTVEYNRDTRMWEIHMTDVER